MTSYTLKLPDSSDWSAPGSTGTLERSRPLQLEAFGCESAVHGAGIAKPCAACVCFVTLSNKTTAFVSGSG